MSIRGGVGKKEEVPFEDLNLLERSAGRRKFLVIELCKKIVVKF